MLVDGRKYPITADVTKTFLDQGFGYRDLIVWRKPDGRVRATRRSGSLLQHPYPMYLHMDNLTESILLFQKGDFDYKSVAPSVKQSSMIDVTQVNEAGWCNNVWEIANCRPGLIHTEGVAEFPAEIPHRLVTLYSHKGETVLDPFCGSGTTLRVAKELGRNSVGYEIQPKLVPLITSKVGDDLTVEFRKTEDSEQDKAAA
jgi:site-specific DNA-methyltransferase (adenine-specific)